MHSVTTQTAASEHLPFESFKLTLIENSAFRGLNERDPLMTKDAIKYLIRSLEHADATFTADVENLLTQIGPLAVPYLLKGLASGSINVKSTCAMVLIRIGPSCVEAVQQFYCRYQHREKVAYSAAFILEELCAPAPTVDLEQPILTTEQDTPLQYAG